MFQYLVSLNSPMYDSYFQTFLNFNRIHYKYLNDTQTYIINTTCHCADLIKRISYVKYVNLDIKIPIKQSEIIEPIEQVNQFKFKSVSNSDEWYIDEMRFNNLWSKKFYGEGVNVAIIGNGYVRNNSAQPIIKQQISFVDNEIGSIEDTPTSIALGIISHIAPKCNMTILKVIDSNNMVKISAVIEALEWCIDNYIDIAYLPFSVYEMFNSDFNIMYQSIKISAKNGLISISPSGDNNEPSINSPSNSSSIMSVGAIDKNYKRWKKNEYTGSNYGTGLDFVAPGYKIKAPVSYSTNLSGYALITGTNPSGALFTGLAILLFDKYISEDIRLDFNGMKKILKISALPLPQENPNPFEYGNGLARAEPS